MNTCLITEKFLEIINSIPKKTVGISMSRVNFLQSWLCEQNIDQFVNFLINLGDKESKELLVRLLHNSLGVFFTDDDITYSFFNHDEWTKLLKEAKSIDCIQNSYDLDIIETFILEGYNYKNIICAKKGQTVIDCGTFTGNTALYFSKSVGSSGKIYAFEAMPQTFSQLQENMLNKNCNNVITIEAAINSKSGVAHFSTFPGPGASITSNKKLITVKSISIDDFVRENHIKK